MRARDCREKLKRTENSACVGERKLYNSVTPKNIQKIFFIQKRINLERKPGCFFSHRCSLRARMRKKIYHIIETAPKIFTHKHYIETLSPESVERAVFFLGVPRVKKILARLKAAIILWQARAVSNRGFFAAPIFPRLLRII